MAANLSLGQQLTGMLNAIQRYDQSIPGPSTGAQNTDVSFMTLVWPLLPLLPPEPPTIVAELLRQHDTCDVCGTGCEKGLITCKKLSTGMLAPVPTSIARLRKITTDTKSPLDQLMGDIEKKMTDTLNSIEATTKKQDQLNKKTKALDESGKCSMTDAELLQKLKSLVNEKSKREAKVKDLELKEQNLKEKLITAIEWAKSIDTKGQDVADEKSTEEKSDEERLAQLNSEFPLNNLQEKQL